METIYKWNFVKLGAALCAILYFGYCIFFVSEWHFIDFINLTFHEAGHTLSIAFPQIIQVLMGSVFQFFIPVVFALYFYDHTDYFSSAIVTLWASQSLANISHYMRDAQTMLLPLLGGDNATHDWNYIFTTFNMLDRTSSIANFIYIAACIMIITAGINAIIYSREKFNRNSERVFNG